MKIGIIGFANLSYMPYLYKYTKIFEELDVEFEIIYWDRKGLNEGNSFKTHAFKSRLDDSESRFGKLFPFIGFRHFASGIIKTSRYDFLLVLGTIPAVLLYALLTGKYRHKFILDIRDITYEDFRMYRMFVAQLVKNSSMTCISSEGFKQVLPGYGDYVMSHNIPTAGCSNAGVQGKRHEDGRIQIAYWGLIRQTAFNKRLIDKLGGDGRFELYYHGSGNDAIDELTAFCYQKGYDNVYFTGSYKPDEKVRFVRETHIIHNAYENDRVMTTATSNKFYDSLIYHIPQIVTKGSHMAELQNINGIGYSVDVDNPYLADQLYEWFKGLEWEAVDRCCDVVLKQVLEEDLRFEQWVRCLLIPNSDHHQYIC